MGNWILEAEDAAAEKVRAELAKPLAECRDDIGDDSFFDPWRLFPALYGSYSNDFDDMAITVLQNIADNGERQEALAHQMFREMLCASDLCNYGTSPRACFATSAFKAILLELLAKWRAYYAVQWGSAIGDNPCT